MPNCFIDPRQFSQSYQLRPCVYREFAANTPRESLRLPARVLTSPGERQHQPDNGQTRADDGCFAYSAEDALLPNKTCPG